MTSQEERIRALEAMLFASPGAVKTVELAEATGWPPEQIKEDTVELQKQLEGRGIELARVAGALRLVTRPDQAEYVEKLLQVQTKKRLTRAQLEVLAIVAYKQPVTRAQLEQFRGINCDRTLAQLSDLNLVRQLGRADLPGRPFVFGTTPEFLQHFGIDRLSELPKLEWPQEESPKPAEPAPPPLRSKHMDELAEDISNPSSGLEKLLGRIRRREERESEDPRNRSHSAGGCSTEEEEAVTLVERVEDGSTS